MKRLAAFVVMFFIWSVLLSAQELDATVVVNVEQLPTITRERVENFKNQVQAYLNNTKFTGRNWQGEKIKCTFNIFFNGSSDEVTYTAQLVVSSQRIIENTSLNSLMMSILDNSWQFRYQKNQAMYYNQTDFDPLTSFLDYYANIIIGFDSDSYYSLGGTDYFQKALDICVKGGSSQFNQGWQLESLTFNRRALVDNLLNAKYQQFRQDYFDYHYNGIDLFQDPKTRDLAVKNIVKLITDLYDIKDRIDTRSVLMKVFFDAKAKEIVEYLKNYPDKSIFEILKKINPPHTARYDEALKLK